jgi:cystathionine beta-lyase
LKCAEVIVTCEDDLVRWEPRRHDLAHGASTLGMVANRAAFDDGDEWLHETVAYLQGNRDLVRDLLASHLPCIHWFAPDATYLAWLDCRDLSVADPAAFFLQEARVALNDGASFGAGGEGHVRLNFACSRPLLLEMIDRLARATNHLRPKRPQ